MSAARGLLLSLSRASLFGAVLTAVLLAGGAADAAPAGFGAAGFGARSAALASAGRASALRAAQVPAAPAFGSGSPASDSLSDVSCLSASSCMAVGGSLAEEWNGRAWRVVKSSGTSLSAVSCSRPSFCMAIGTGPQVWNGRAWRVVKSPGVGVSALSCPRASFCMAVGTGSDGESSVSQLWNGRAWRVLKTPDIGCVPLCGLSAVSCPSAGNCWAVGRRADDSGGTEEGVGLRWSRGAWHRAGTITPNFAFLSGISCASATRCVAVGGYQTNGPGPCLATICILAVAWDGSTWRQLDTPMVGPSLSTVSCAAGGCVAIGGTAAGSWDGSTWRQQAIVTPGETGSSPSAVSCWRPSACMAVGSYMTAGARLTLAEQWNGRSWQIRRTPSPGDAASGLLAVSCRRGRPCMAVGSYISAADTRVTLAEEWDGRTWRVRATPRPTPSPGASALSAVSCPAAARCMAVGYSDTTGGQQALAEMWNGSSWQVRAAPRPGVSSELSGVWCTSRLSCVAVGSYLQPSGTRLALAEAWNGSAWQVQTTPDTGFGLSKLAGVWCGSGVRCIAVGDEGTPVSAGRPLAEAWNGTRWRLLATPVLSGPAELTAVACPRPSTCMAVGDYIRSFSTQPVRTLSEIWNGTTWRIRATPGPGKRRLGHLAAVSCPGPGSCRAAGGFTSPSGSTAALAEAWNGSRWRPLSISSPSPQFSDLNGISCSLSARCFAVGETATQRTLAESWDGTRWRLLTTANP